MLVRSLTPILVFVLVGCEPPTTSFDDHTLATLPDVAAYERFAITAHGRSSEKFIVTDFAGDHEDIRFLDSAFYSLHDEWYWFRLLNGERIPGREGIVPVKSGDFRSIADIYTWAKTTDPLPLDLRWVEGDRLYSPRFYELALSQKPRALGLGTLVHVTEEGGRMERWAFQLEYTDAPTHAELVRFFERLKATLPPELAPKLYWVVRSQVQENLARDIETQRLPYFDRIIRMRDLAIPGEVEVYNEGLTAGRLKLLESGDSLQGTTSRDVLILEDVPDVLPQAAGVITSVPQTPLAHFNLLARNRGIPNAYQGGVTEDQALRDLARYRTPVVVRAQANGGLVIKAISEAQYAAWLQAQAKVPASVDQVDVSTLPYIVDLRTLSANQSETLRPAFGGKATGYLGLLDGAPEAAPDQLMAISIRAYVEHVASMKERLATMLATSAFTQDARVRELVLEGPKRYLSVHTAAADRSFVQDFLAARPAGDVLADFARSEGVKGLIRSTHIAPATVTTLTEALRTRFGHYAVTQGLRFRSSSTAEDVEGFNGAGLYDSNTGFLDPSAQPDPGDRDHGVEWAILKTWASYWSIEAYEERALEKIDHLSGNMGVVVHARFDDEKEKSNGVFLFTVQGEKSVMDLNVQLGAVSVTNPSSTALPEVVRVTQANATAQPVIERLRACTLVPAGTQVLNDAELLETFARGKSIATKWLTRVNDARPVDQRASTLVLDFEFRQVPEGWPALQTGTFPARIVLKQTRSLEPGLRGLSSEVGALPIPRDVLSRSRRVERRVCASTGFSAEVVEVTTDPLMAPDLGYSVSAFTASISIRFTKGVTELGIADNELVHTTHRGLLQAVHGPAGMPWSIDATWTGNAHFSRSTFSDGRYSFDTYSGTDLHCTVTVLRSTPSELLLSYLTAQ